MIVVKVIHNMFSRKTVNLLTLLTGCAILIVQSLEGLMNFLQCSLKGDDDKREPGGRKVARRSESRAAARSLGDR
jgi:hypothetical protein